MTRKGCSVLPELFVVVVVGRNLSYHQTGALFSRRGYRSYNIFTMVLFYFELELDSAVWITSLQFADGPEEAYLPTDDVYLDVFYQTRNYRLKKRYLQEASRRLADHSMASSRTGTLSFVCGSNALTPLLAQVNI